MDAADTAVLAAATGALCALLATPVAARVAVRTGFLDRPVGYKEHGRPTPYLGGSAVLLAFVVVALAYGDGTDRFLPLVLGAVALWAVGTMDDRVNLSPWLRLAAGVGAAGLLWAGDLGWAVFGEPALDLALTVVWVVGIVNAFNLMDNLDGASGTVAAAAAIGAGSFALGTGDIALAAVAFGLAGACLGFLRHNLTRPARIFLGDGGSMPIGLVVATAAMGAPQVDELGLGAVLCAALVVGLVILDTTLVVVSRRRRGAAVLSGARDHLTHRLLAMLGTPQAVAALLGAVQLGLGAVALAAAGLGRPAVLWTSAALVVAGIAVIAYLERAPSSAPLPAAQAPIDGPAVAAAPAASE